MPINLSTILEYSTPETMVAMRPELVAEARRLEAYHGKIDGFIADNNRDEPPKECERKPLKWNNGELVCALIRDADNVCISTHTSLKNAETHAASYKFPTSIVRVLEPVGNECPTERIAPEVCEWGIMGIWGNEITWCGLNHNFYTNFSFLEGRLRFPSSSEAASYITEHGLTNCQPWPIPPKGGAE